MADTFVQSIAQATGPEELLQLLNDFLGVLNSARSARHLPYQLRPSRILSVDQLQYWLGVLHAEIERQEANGRLSDGVMFYVKEVLDTANMRIQYFQTRSNML